MAIKKHSEYYDLVLQILKDSGPMSQSELRETIAMREALTEEEKRFSNDRGTNIFGSRIHWSTAVLVLAGLLHRPERAHVAITELGLRLLEENPHGISDDLVKSQQAYKEMEERARQNKIRKGEKQLRTSARPTLTQMVIKRPWSNLAEQFKNLKIQLQLSLSKKFRD
jgi:restriction endonuclease Mrr